VGAVKMSLKKSAAVGFYFAGQQLCQDLPKQSDKSNPLMPGAYFLTRALYKNTSKLQISS